VVAGVSLVILVVAIQWSRRPGGLQSFAAD
jgi:hypothetical protein